MSALKRRGFQTACGGILLCCALVMSGALAQNDCTGVECPALENCIEETLETGACCASCLQWGCKCEGYEYYDCLYAGHRGGKVPAGTSYYVDSGSTECKCPEGGGKIRCSFIPCPELPKNCIKSFQPHDGCPQCARLGCVSSGHKYPAGHSFRVEPCTVCHCLSSGSLMCTPDPDPGCGREENGLEPTDGVLSDQKDPSRGQGAEARRETEERAAPTDGKRASARAEPEGGRRLAALNGDETRGLMATSSQQARSVVAQEVEKNQTSPLQLSRTTERAVFEESLASCCAAGSRWAVEDGKCLKISSHGGDSELCRELQEQCCLSTLEETRCQSGIDAANRGGFCTLEANDACGADVFKRCCKCCSLGLQARSQGVACDQIPPLGHACGQVSAACCRETDNHLPSSSSNRREPRRPQETASTEAEAEEGGEGEGEGGEDGRRNPAQASPSEVEDRCKDVNECVTGNHNCSRQQWCINLDGSFRCAHSMELCEEGYSMNEQGTCVDVDECQDRSDRCSPNLICQNTPGSFLCRPRAECGPGLTLDTRGSCVDTNECVTLSQPCATGFNCINTIGSYSCHRNIISCGRGYAPSEDNARCVDIDECQTGTHRCDSEQICRNVPGSFRCDCRQGYRMDPFSKTCVDIDECRRYAGRICAQKCENSPGSYHCTCRAGFRLTEDGRNCEDVNECETSPCSQDCANVYGSFQCYCRHGYTLSQLDRTTCEDIDECSLTASTLCAYHCVNSPGSFNCVCPEEGYALSPNGRNCRDLDECALGTHNCTTTETCFNIQGGFKCLSFDCPANYRRTAQSRCERLSCQDYVECQTVPQRITYYQLSFPTNIRVPANIFRISPAPVYAGDNILLSIVEGNEGMYFSTRRLNNYTGFVYLQLPPRQPKDFLLDVEMTLIRQGTATKFIARIYVFITGPAL
ncbi:fibulin-1-like isoform X2 [Heptranchias perlo]|uniref:fibulin-1-like isoform X2 n=1 Tax=Heptranchias perlo TaxID=212740 RepID=UPI00355A7ADC